MANKKVDQGWFEELISIQNWWGDGDQDIRGWFDPDLIVAPIASGAITYMGYYMPQGWF